MGQMHAKISKTTFFTWFNYIQTSNRNMHSDNIYPFKKLNNPQEKVYLQVIPKYLPNNQLNHNYLDKPSLQQLSLRYKDINHPNLLNIKGVFHTTRQELNLKLPHIFRQGACQEFLCIALEFFDLKLENQVQTKKTYRTKFTEQELWMVADSVISGMAYLQQKNISVGNLDERGIFMTRQNKNNYKISPVIPIIRHFQSQRNGSIQKAKRKLHFKNDLFQIGKIFLDITNLQHSNVNNMNMKLQKAKYSYSQIWVDFLTDILKPNPQKRLDALELFNQSLSQNKQSSIKVPFSSKDTSKRIYQHSLVQLKKKLTPSKSALALRIPNQKLQNQNKPLNVRSKSPMFLQDRNIKQSIPHINSSNVEVTRIKQQPKPKSQVPIKQLHAQGIKVRQKTPMKRQLLRQNRIIPTRTTRNVNPYFFPQKLRTPNKVFVPSRLRDISPLQVLAKSFQSGNSFPYKQIVLQQQKVNNTKQNTVQQTSKVSKRKPRKIATINKRSIPPLRNYRKPKPKQNQIYNNQYLQLTPLLSRNIPHIKPNKLTTKPGQIQQKQKQNVQSKQNNQRNLTPVQIRKTNKIGSVQSNYYQRSNTYQLLNPRTNHVQRNKSPYYRQAVNNYNPYLAYQSSVKKTPQKQGLNKSASFVLYKQVKPSKKRGPNIGQNHALNKSYFITKQYKPKQHKQPLLNESKSSHNIVLNKVFKQISSNTKQKYRKQSPYSLLQGKRNLNSSQEGINPHNSTKKLKEKVKRNAQQKITRNVFAPRQVKNKIYSFSKQNPVQPPEEKQKTSSINKVSKNSPQKPPLQPKITNLPIKNIQESQQTINYDYIQKIEEATKTLQKEETIPNKALNQADSKEPEMANVSSQVHTSPRNTNESIKTRQTLQTYHEEEGNENSEKARESLSSDHEEQERLLETRNQDQEGQTSQQQRYFEYFEEQMNQLTKRRELVGKEIEKLTEDVLRGKTNQQLPQALKNCFIYNAPVPKVPKLRLRPLQNLDDKNSFPDQNNENLPLSRERNEKSSLSKRQQSQGLQEDLNFQNTLEREIENVFTTIQKQSEMEKDTDGYLKDLQNIQQVSSQLNIIKPEDNLEKEQSFASSNNSCIVTNITSEEKQNESNENSNLVYEDEYLRVMDKYSQYLNN